MAISGCWQPYRRLVGICRAGLGGLLGVGPGRERQLYALVGGHCFPSLYYDAEKAGNTQGLEYGADNTNLRPNDIWHFPDPEWNPFLSSYFWRIDFRTILFSLYRYCPHWLAGLTLLSQKRVEE